MTDSDDALVTLDLSGPETPGRKFGRILIGGILLVVFGLLALACGVLFFFGAFIPGVSDFWFDWVIDFAPFIGAIFFGFAIVGLVLLQRGRKAEASVAGIANFLEATGLADVETVRDEPQGPPGKPHPPTVV